MFCFCKLCERDKIVAGNITMAHIGVSHVRTDRLAVLEKDHRAMERLRSKPSFYIAVLFGAKRWMATSDNMSIECFQTDPADAILAEGGI